MTINTSRGVNGKFEIFVWPATAPHEDQLRYKAWPHRDLHHCRRCCHQADVQKHTVPPEFEDPVQDILASVTISLKKYGYRPLISWPQSLKLTALPDIIPVT